MQTDSYPQVVKNLEGNPSPQLERSYRPYISLDVETTGLDSGSNRLLSFAITFDYNDSVKPEDLPYMHIGIGLEKDEVVYGSDVALKMNEDLIKDLENARELGAPVVKGLRSEAVIIDDHDIIPYLISSFLRDCRKIIPDIDTWKDQRFQLVCKNPGGVDVPFMKAFLGNDKMEEFFSHRAIDVGSMFVKEFGYNPGMSAVIKKLGLEHEVAHNAYADSLDNINAFRHIMLG